ncbi:MAG: sigma-70 family RNA polymerase sigma factor [Chryseolinea sp.]
MSFVDKDYSRKLFPYAYNVLGSVEDARDAVQETMAKHVSQAGKYLTDEKNYLIRSVINLSINMKARQRKTMREGERWLPEPIATSDEADRDIYLKDILSYSLLILMEQLSPKERAVFILKESFDYSHEEISDLLAITEMHSRKLLSRAKAELFKPGSKRNPTMRMQERAVLENFIIAIRERDTQKLEGAMAADIEFHADGGGKIPVASLNCIGSSQVAALQLMVYQKYLTRATLIVTEVNHQPALLSIANGVLTSCQVFTLDLRKAKIAQINALLDPQKLKSLYFES